MLHANTADASAATAAATTTDTTTTVANTTAATATANTTYTTAATAAATATATASSAAANSTDTTANTTTDPTNCPAAATCSVEQRLPSLSAACRFPDRGEPGVGKLVLLNIHAPQLLSRVARPFRHPAAAAPAPICLRSLPRH